MEIFTSIDNLYDKINNYWEFAILSIGKHRNTKRPKSINVVQFGIKDC